MPYDLIDTATAPALSGTFGSPQTNVGKTLSILRAELSLRLKKRDDVDTPTLDGWINDAYREMCGELDLEEAGAQLQFTTTIGQASYKLPTGIFTLERGSVVDVSLPNGGFTLDKIDEYKYRSLEKADGCPSHFFRYANYAVLWPTPDTARVISLTGTVEPQPLTGTTDSPFFATRLHYALVLKARAIALDALDEGDAANEALAKYLASIRPKQTQQALETRGLVMRVSSPRRSSDLNFPRSR